jgi:arylsulfatase
MLFEVDEPKPGSGGTVTLFVNGEPAGGGQMPKTVPITFTSYAGMDISRDNGLVVDREYEAKAPYGFTGTVRQVTFDLQPVEAAAKHGHHEELHRHEQHQAVAAGAAS